jgi:hypothetical protein
MASDRARVSYDPTRKWRGLIAQQGRVTVEADWNEATAIAEDHDRRLTLDFVGPFATPVSPHLGYTVTAGPGPGDLTIGTGTLYVGGERLDLGAPVIYGTQPEWLDRSSDALWRGIAPPPAGTQPPELVYLLASEREVSAVEDPALADVALGGPDTMQRRRIIQRFVRQPGIPSPDPAKWWSSLAATGPSRFFGGLKALNQATMLLESTTTLQVSFPAPDSLTSPGQPGTSSGYLGAENQMIRVMVAEVGTDNLPAVVWGFDDASFLYRVQSATYDASTNTTAITLAGSPVDSYHHPALGQAVELLRDSVQLTPTDYIASAAGFVSTVSSAYDPSTKTLVIAGGPPADYLPPVATAPAAPPTVTGVNPGAGVVAGGTPVTVTGTGFTGATQVSFGSNPGIGLLVQSDTQLTITSPAATVAGQVPVVVTTPAGGSPAAGGPQFTYAAPAAPTVTGLSPSAGVLSGGTLVTITGSGFTTTTAVHFGSNPGIGVAVQSDTELTVLSPAGTGADVVTVITPQGTSSSVGVASNTFTYATTPPPQVTAIRPAGGGPAGGTVVTVAGTGFTGATAVNFDGVAGAGLNVLADTELTVTSPTSGPLPAGGTKSVDVTVVTPTGSSPAGPADKFTYELEVTGLSPSIGPPPGGTSVTVSGSGFTGATAVNFGAITITELSVLSDIQLTVTAPPGTGTVNVTVTTPDGTSPAGPGNVFVYEETPLPYLRVWQALAAEPQGQSPSTGADGSVIVPLSLTGIGVDITLIAGNANFHAGDFWRFALRPSTPTSVYPARYAVQGQPPDGPRTWICPLAILTWSGSSATVVSCVPPFWNLVALTTAVIDHVALPTPAVTIVSPSTGAPTGGTVVTVTGSGFTGATVVHFGPNAGTGLSVRSDAELTVTSPAGSGIVDVTVTTPTGTSPTGSVDRFAYLVVAGVSPAIGRPSGGTVVTLTGSGFTGATGVIFGTLPGTAMTVVSDTEITVTAPAGSGVVDVRVTGPLGPSPVEGTDLFAYAEATGLSPSAGPVSGGTIVTVTGSGFGSAGVTAVQFGPTAGDALSVASDTDLTVRSPGGSGQVPVTVITPQGSVPMPAALSFTYQGKGKEVKDKEIIKDVTKEKELSKDIAKDTDKVHLDKTLDQVKTTDRVKVTDVKTIDQVKTVDQVKTFDRGLAKAVETKPAETPSSGVSDPGPPAEPAPEEEVGRAFIEPEERPAVGDSVIDDEE